jgi:hypothetical protein
VAERAREACTELAQSSLRAASPGGFRPDVMMYIADALEMLEKFGAKQEIGFEIALLGQHGLDVIDPAQKYTVKSLPGRFSGLRLLALMYTPSTRSCRGPRSWNASSSSRIRASERRWSSRTIA